MSVFNRQLFQQGGEVLEVRQTGSQLNPKEFTFTLDYVDGQPVAIKKQTQGLGQTEDEIIPIQTNLSASGDPKEAFDVMRKNEMLTTARNTAIGLPAAILGGKGIVGSRIASASLPYLQRAVNFLGRNVSPVNFRPFGLVGPTAPASLINPTGSIVTGTTAASIGTGAAMTTPEDVAQSEEGKKIAAELEELERKAGVTGRTSYEAAIKSAIEKAEAGEIPPPVKTVKIGVDGNEVLETEDGVPYRDQVIMLRDKMKELYGEDSPLAEEFLNKPKQKESIDIEEIGEDELAKKRTREESLEKFGVDTTELGKEKEVPLLQNKNFLDLMRNIGIKMVETGDLGRGISLGSAEALKEGRAERLLEEERQSELDKIFTEYGLDRRNSLDVARAEAIYEANLVGSAPPDVSDIKNINQLEQDYVASMQSSQNKKYTAKQVEDVIQVLKSSAGQVFGVNNIIQSNFKKIMEFIAGDPTLRGSSSDISEGLKSENPREYIKTILEIVQNKNIKELLGESGRTISNLDRQVVEKIVGQLKDTSVLSQSPKAVATKLQLLYDNLIREAQQDEDKARINANNLTLLGRDPATLITSSEPQEQRRERIRASDYT